ncbi:MAG: hypothetical protein R2932_44370 [Caldilineaceae bacterium]
MRRGYLVLSMRAGRCIREILPDTAIHTDIIVGFCGESDEQFERTVAILYKLKLDKVHPGATAHALARSASGA